MGCIFIETEFISTLVFDEIDAGIGGGIALSVGEKLSRIANSKQILCITHLPQVAVQGQWHLLVTKTNDADVEINTLDTAPRTDEIARMLGGIEITQQTLAHAEEMLQRVTDSSLD